MPITSIAGQWTRGTRTRTEWSWSERRLTATRMQSRGSFTASPDAAGARRVSPGSCPVRAILGQQHAGAGGQHEVPTAETLDCSRVARRDRGERGERPAADTTAAGGPGPARPAGHL